MGLCCNNSWMCRCIYLICSMANTQCMFPGIHILGLQRSLHELLQVQYPLFEFTASLSWSKMFWTRPNQQWDPAASLFQSTLARDWPRDLNVLKKRPLRSKCSICPFWWNFQWYKTLQGAKAKPLPQNVERGPRAFRLSTVKGCQDLRYQVDIQKLF